MLWSTNRKELAISSDVRRGNLIHEERDEVLSILDKCREYVRESIFARLDGIDNLLDSSSSVLLERTSDSL